MRRLSLNYDGEPRTVDVRIPAGVDTGSRLRSAGNGSAGMRGGPQGDLYVVLHVKPHEIFQRDGDDLLCEVGSNNPVSVPRAVATGSSRLQELRLLRLLPGRYRSRF